MSCYRYTRGCHAKVVCADVARKLYVRMLDVAPNLPKDADVGCLANVVCTSMSRNRAEGQMP